MKYRPFLFLWIIPALLFCSCGKEQQVARVVPIEFEGRPTYRSCALTTSLADGWEAGFAEGYFSDEADEDTDFYEVTLELPGDDGNIMVPFEAAFALSDLPADILDRPTDALVSYDEKTKTVTFDMGTAKIYTKVPQ